MTIKWVLPAQSGLGQGWLGWWCLQVGWGIFFSVSQGVLLTGYARWGWGWALMSEVMVNASNTQSIFSLTFLFTSKNFAIQQSMQTLSPLLRSPSALWTDALAMTWPICGVGLEHPLLFDWTYVTMQLKMSKAMLILERMNRWQRWVEKLTCWWPSQFTHGWYLLQAQQGCN